jgi:uncharacterized protein
LNPDAGNVAASVIGGGFALAFVFGVIANKTNFCTMGALSDIVNMGHWNRMRMWLLAIAVAVLGVGLLGYSGQIDASKAIVQRPMLPWLSLLLGGLTFGIGMTLAGGCANKNLIRVGGGSVRSLVVLVFLAIAAYMTLKGLFGQWRASLLDPVALNLADFGWKDQSLATAASRLTGLSPVSAQLGTMCWCWGCWGSSSRTAAFAPMGCRSAAAWSSACWWSRVGMSPGTLVLARTPRRWRSATSPPTRAPSSR